MSRRQNIRFFLGLDEAINEVSSLKCRGLLVEQGFFHCRKALLLAVCGVWRDQLGAVRNSGVVLLYITLSVSCIFELVGIPRPSKMPWFSVIKLNSLSNGIRSHANSEKVHFCKALFRSRTYKIGGLRTVLVMSYYQSLLLMVLLHRGGATERHLGIWFLANAHVKFSLPAYSQVLWARAKCFVFFCNVYLSVKWLVIFCASCIAWVLLLYSVFLLDCFCSFSPCKIFEVCKFLARIQTEKCR